MTANLFNETAAIFAKSIDAQLARDEYTRGKLFLRAVQQHVLPGGYVLDYGCGPGRIAFLVAQQKYNVVGFDPSPNMIVEAEKLPKNGLELEFRVDTTEGHELGVAKYNAIVCSSVIEYVPQAGDLLACFRRSLLPSGHLIISYSNRMSLWRKYAKMRYGKTAAFYQIQYNIWTFIQFRNILERTGFQILGAAKYFEAAPFDKRPALSFLSSFAFIGTLGLVVARRKGDVVARA